MIGGDAGTGFIYDRSDLFLGTPNAPVFFQQLALRALENQKQAAASKSAAKEKLTTQKPEEYWISHDIEMRESMEELNSMGAEILMAGADPFQGTDPASIEFRKKASRIQEASKFSMQMKEYHKFVTEKLAQEAKEGGDRYSEESKAAAWEYLNTPLFANMDSGQIPPVLEVKRPWIDLLAYDSKFSKDAQTAGKEYDDTDIAAFAQQSLTNPSIAESISSQLSALGKESPEAMEILKNKAQNAGMNIQQYVRYEQMKPHFSKTPFDFESVEKQMMPELDKATKETGDVTTTWEGVSNKKATALATAIVEANPKYIQEGVKQGRFGDPTKTIEQNRKAAIDWNVKRIMNTVASKTSRLEDEEASALYGGYGREEVRANGDEWLKALRSNQPDQIAEAVGYLVNNKIKTSDGRTIKSYTIRPYNENGKSGYMVRLITTKGIEQKDEDGNKFYKEDVGEIIFDPRDETGLGGLFETSTDEEMLNWHDASFKTSKRPFQTKITDFKGPVKETGSIYFKLPGQ